MLQTIRENSKGIVAKIIVGLIAVTFALFGVESLVSLTAGSNAPATVNGEEISEHTLMQSVATQKRQILSQMGQNADPSLLDDNLIAGMVIDGLIEQEVLRQEALKRGMSFSTNMVDQLIVNTPAFQLDGAFNADQFTATLRGAGLTPLSYRQLVEVEKLAEQQNYGIVLSSFLTDADVERLISLDRQTRSFDYFLLKSEDAAKDVSVTDEEIQARYDENQAEYTSEESVVLEYVELNQRALEDEVSVTDADLQEAYVSLQASYEGEELRQAAHIMVEINDDQNASAALEKANAIKARLDAGEDFAVVAKETSDDFASAEFGGDLGLNAKGVFDPAFDDALFALETGQVSAPVETDFGYHIIRLGAVESSDVPSLEEVKGELTADIKTEKAEALFVEQSTTLADVSYSAGDLGEPAETLGLDIRTTPSATRFGNVDVVTSSPRVMEAAFSDEVLKEGLNSTLIEISPTQAVVVRVKQHDLPRPQDLAEVADKIAEELKAEKTAARLTESADEAVAALRKGQSLAIAAGASSLTSIKEANRTHPEASPEVLQYVFKMAHPEDGKTVSSTLLANGDYAVVVLSNVENGKTDGLTAEDRMQIAQNIAARQGQDNYREYTQSLVDQAEVERRY